MKIKRTETGFLLVLDAGDEIIESLKKLAASERIGLASLTGIGSVRNAVLGYIDLDLKQYLKREYGPESVELLSLTGNMTRLDGEPFPHCHVVLGDREMRTFGGHLFAATVSATVEIFARVFEGEVSRQFNEEFGLNCIQL
jgi:hypothetical protein